MSALELITSLDSMCRVGYQNMKYLGHCEASGLAVGGGNSHVHSFVMCVNRPQRLAG